MKTMLFAMLLAALAVVAQTALDPTQSGAYPKYPAYIDHKCGVGDTAITQTQYAEQANDDGTVTSGFRFTTKCPGSGRGSLPTIYETCWAISFAADRYVVLQPSDELLATHWKQGQPAVSCPAL